MKRISILSLFLFISLFSKAQETSYFVDERDQTKYKTVKIGNQWWMAENLRWKYEDPDLTGYFSPEDTWVEYGSWCYNDKEANCKKYGRLYGWTIAKRYACPSGWRLPTAKEWSELFNSAGGKTNALNTLESNNFNLLMSGYGSFSSRKFTGDEQFDFSLAYNISDVDIAKYIGSWLCLDKDALFWSSDVYNAQNYQYYYAHFRKSSLFTGLYFLADNALSVRCVKEDNTPSGENSNPSGNNPSQSQTPLRNDNLVDSRDNKTYKTVIIGNKLWMAENLNYQSGGYGVCYDNKSENCQKYGTLYSWQDAQKACPGGWHLPDKSEFESLMTQIKNDGYGLFSSLMNGGHSGFNALNGGWQAGSGFAAAGERATFWTSTETGTNSAWVMGTNGSESKVEMVNTAAKVCGFSVRCVKD